MKVLGKESVVRTLMSTHSQHRTEETEKQGHIFLCALQAWKDPGSIRQPACTVTVKHCEVRVTQRGMVSPDSC